MTDRWPLDDETTSNRHQLNDSHEVDEVILRLPCAVDQSPVDKSHDPDTSGLASYTEFHSLLLLYVVAEQQIKLAHGLEHRKSTKSNSKKKQKRLPQAPVDKEVMVTKPPARRGFLDHFVFVRSKSRFSTPSSRC